MKDLVGDSNANNMDKALEVLCVYLERADEAAAARCAGGPGGRAGESACVVRNTTTRQARGRGAFVSIWRCLVG